MKFTYHPLAAIEDFWDNRNPPAAESEFTEFETKHKISVPMLLKKLFIISNGGFSEHGSIQSNGLFLSMFPEWIPPISKWEPFSEYVDSFSLDDDESLSFKRDYPDAFICYRHGFDVFSLFWNSPDPSKSEIGLLDMNAPVGAADRFVKLTVGSDPTQVFFSAVEEREKK
ncbi:MAG: hypothetical protein B7Y39_01630 [Bdellovibrio sp. 28-41-41]|nr:MAG: hypothetical protein B7Y39_01630 [Bdellovibrio sp. 28-41-41]